MRKILVSLAIITMLTGGIFSWFASQHPDGLEWSMSKVSGKEELESPAQGIHAFLGHVQSMTAFLPDYGFKDSGESNHSTSEAPLPEAGAIASIDMGTSVSGLVGGIITLTLIALIGMALKKRTTQT